MPIPVETLRSQQKLNVIFAISSVATLASLLWMVMIDHQRDWHAYQEKFNVAQAAMAHLDYVRTQSDDFQNKMNELQGALAEAGEELESEGTQTTVAKINAELGGLKAEYEAVRRLFANLNANLTVTRSDYEHAKTLHGEDDDHTHHALKKLETEQDVLAEVRGDKERIEDRQKVLETQLKGIYAQRDAIEKSLGALEREREAALAKQDDYSNVLKKAIWNIPLLDFAAPKGTPQRFEVKQAVLPDVLTDLNFEKVKTTDRCMTCHFSIDNKAYAPEMLARQFSESLPMIIAARQRSGQGAVAVVELLALFNEHRSAHGHRKPLSKALTTMAEKVDAAADEEAVAAVVETAKALPENERSAYFPILVSVAAGNEGAIRVLDLYHAVREDQGSHHGIGGLSDELGLEMEALDTEREDLGGAGVLAYWDRLPEPMRKEYLQILLAATNVYLEGEGLSKLDLGPALMAHPDLDLFVSPDSPHPMAKMGCTVCHDGNGQETDFMLAAHTAPTHEQLHHWEEAYMPAVGGTSPHTVEHYWDYPMLLPKYTQANCVKCHTKVADISTVQGETLALGREINVGRHLFKSLGCTGCHLADTEELGAARQVGPDLTNISGKLSKGFVHQWVHSPKNFRPSTWMPSYFDQENNGEGCEEELDPDPVYRTQTEVMAMTHYLFEVSNSEWKPAPTDLEGDPERGRQLFGKAGCLACHTTLAHVDGDDPDGSTLGEKWIVAALRGFPEDGRSAAGGGGAEFFEEDGGDEFMEEGEEEFMEEDEEESDDEPEDEEAGDSDAVEAKEGDEAKVKEEAPESANEKPAEASKENADGDQAEDAAPATSAEPGSGDALLTGEDDADGEAEEVEEDAADDEDATGEEEPADEGDSHAAEPSEFAVQVTRDEQGHLSIRYVPGGAQLSFEAARKIYNDMSYNDRVEFAMRHLPTDLDGIFDSESVEDRPVFTRFAPELSNVGQKVSREWIYDWVRNPRHYSSYTKMPSLRLTDQEAADVATYLSTLKANKPFAPTEFVRDEKREKKVDELMTLLLRGQNSAEHTKRIIADEGGELTDTLVRLLKGTMGEDKARGKISSMDLPDKQLMFLGSKMITHYGCFACHKIGGYETASRPGTELTTWGQKSLAQLDFAYFFTAYDGQRGPEFDKLYPEFRKDLIGKNGNENPDQQVLHNRQAFAWHKLKNPRIWDRKKIKDPYTKLKMPNFFLTDDQADAIVTFLLSLRPARVKRDLQVDYDNTPAGPIADGRLLVRELNCVACHKIEDNEASVHYFYRAFLPDGSFDEIETEIQSPPYLRGEGSKAQAPWLYEFFNNVEMLRPWLKIRMPSFYLDDAQAKTLVDYFAAVSRDEADFLAAHLAPIHRHMAKSSSGEGEKGESELPAEGEAWFEQERLVTQRDTLAHLTVKNKLVRPAELELDGLDREDIAEAYNRVRSQAEFIQGLYDITYPFEDAVHRPIDEQRFKAGEQFFYELSCLSCHVLGDPNKEGSNANPSAPNLNLVHRRLRTNWLYAWLREPNTLQPGTKMPQWFPGGLSAFRDFPDEDKVRMGKVYGQGGQEQMDLLLDFMDAAGRRGYTAIQPQRGGEQAAAN
jgi:cbb3-type cytochrome oxidase cytochrome c subunit